MVVTSWPSRLLVFGAFMAGINLWGVSPSAFAGPNGQQVSLRAPGARLERVRISGDNQYDRPVTWDSSRSGANCADERCEEVRAQGWWFKGKVTVEYQVRGERPVRSCHFYVNESQPGDWVDLVAPADPAPAGAAVSEASPRCLAAPSAVAPRIGIAPPGQTLFPFPTDLPRAHILVSDKSQSGVLGTYCWGGGCRDRTWASPALALQTPQSFEMKLILDAQRDIRDLRICTTAVDESMVVSRPDGVLRWRVKACDLVPIQPLKEQTLNMELATGRHLVLVGSWWAPAGDAIFGFTIDVSPDWKPE